MVLFYYFAFSDRKIRLLVDWFIWPFMGRDIIEMSTDDTDDFEIRNMKFQQGEKIITAGQISHYMYLIREGTCAVYPESKDEFTNPLRKLMVGDIINADGKREEVVAETLVRAIKIREEQRQELEEILALLKSS